MQASIMASPMLDVCAWYLCMRVLKGCEWCSGDAEEILAAKGERQG